MEPPGVGLPPKPVWRDFRHTPRTRGASTTKCWPTIRGSGIFGVVEAVADGVDGFAPGDEVFGMI